MSSFVKFAKFLTSRNIVRNKLNYTNINVQASKFTKHDLKELSVNFQPASNDLVIPNEKIEDFPEKYICPKVNRVMLDQAEFN
ncbi:14518_t:CDS:1, partial [Dentiscutata erythropus]